MNSRKGVLAVVLWMAAIAVSSKPVEVKTSQGNVTVEFYTPSIVRVVKTSQGQTYSRKSRVVIAEPEEVSIVQKGNTLKSSQLTVKIDPNTGCLTFLSAGGKTLLKEKAWSLVRQNETEWQVSQAFLLDKDEPVYGLGTIQNGRMNRRGEHKRMEQSNLEDFQNVIQSIIGWGI